MLVEFTLQERKQTINKHVNIQQYVKEPTALFKKLSGAKDSVIQVSSYGEWSEKALRRGNIEQKLSLSEGEVFQRQLANKPVWVQQGGSY